MGRKSKSFQRIKYFNVLLDDKVIRIELNLNESIKNEDDLIALNHKKRREKTMIKVKKVKQHNEKNQLNANIVQKETDDQSNENKFQFNQFTKKTFNNKNAEFDIGNEFDEFDCFDEFNFENEENYDLFFDMENLFY